MNEEIPLMMEREAGAPDFISALAVGFGMIAVQDKKQSDTKGYPVYVDRLHFRAKVPGDKNQEVLNFAKDTDKKRFPRAWEAYQKRESNAAPDGFPIEQWPQVTRSQAMNFKSMGIYSVEALAEVHDGNIDKLGQNMRELRAKAKAFIAQANDTAAAQKIAAENEALKTQMADMQRQIGELATAAEKRGPGRPRKEAA